MVVNRTSVDVHNDSGVVHTLTPSELKQDADREGDVSPDVALPSLPIMEVLP
jgi:hypothetical protein